MSHLTADGQPTKNNELIEELKITRILDHMTNMEDLLAQELTLKDGG